MVMFHAEAWPYNYVQTPYMDIGNFKSHEQAYTVHVEF